MAPKFTNASIITTMIDVVQQIQKVIIRFLEMKNTQQKNSDQNKTPKLNINVIATYIL